MFQTYFNLTSILLQSYLNQLTPGLTFDPGTEGGGAPHHQFPHLPGARPPGGLVLAGDLRPRPRPRWAAAVCRPPEGRGSAAAVPPVDVENVACFWWWGGTDTCCSTIQSCAHSSLTVEQKHFSEIN